MIWVSCTAASGMSLHFYANTTSWFAFNYSTMSGRQACGRDRRGNPSRTERSTRRPDCWVGTAPKIIVLFSFLWYIKHTLFLPCCYIFQNLPFVYFWKNKRKKAVAWLRSSVLLALPPTVNSPLKCRYINRVNLEIITHPAQCTQSSWFQLKKIK